MNKNVIASLFLLMSTSSNASDFYSQANVSVKDMVQTYANKTQRVVQQVRNTGDAPAFVKVEVFEVIDAHTDNEYEKKLDQSKIPDLVATPQRIVIPPKASRSVGLYLKQRWDYDRFFRVRYTPVQPTHDQGFIENTENINTGASIGIAWGTLVVVPSATPKYKTELVDKGNSFSFNNKGNSFVEISNAELCAKEQCTQEFDLRLLSHELKDISLEGYTSYSAILKEGDKNKTIKWSSNKGLEVS